jgi:HK97 family phage major capsid protein
MQIPDNDWQDLRTTMASALKKTAERLDEYKARILDLEQYRAVRASAGFSRISNEGDAGELADLITRSDGLKSFAAGNTPRFEIRVPSRLVRKNLVVNQTGSGQTLVTADRPRGIAFAPPQRLTIRGLFAQLPTDSNLVEVPSEATFTSRAAPQGDTSPIGNGEGELKAESDITFSLTQFPISTISHWIRASRQILSDAPLLQSHLETRLLYFLALEEESEMLTGDGGAGNLTGINNQAAAFTGGVTNANAIDTLARAANQLAVANYEPSGFILHPTDWLSIKLLKDSNGNYLLGNPQDAKTPMLHGLPVVPTSSQTIGRFTCLDAMRYGYVADREQAVIRVSENVNDDFIRNVIRILAENRVALITELSAAAIYGLLSHAG